MKKLLFLCAILISTLSYGQLIPKGFNIKTINDVDSALVFLSKAINQQHIKIPIKTEVTIDYILQTRQKGKVGGLTLGTRTLDIQKLLYYESITKVYIKYYRQNGWEVHFSSESIGLADYIIFKDKVMAETAFAALLCLIRNSGNENYKKIIAEIRKQSL